MSAARPRVFTIPPGVSFVDALAAGLLAEAGGDPLKLARMIVLLPTRRACRSLREAFLRQSQGAPLLLPRMTPIGDIDEEGFAFAGEESPFAATGLDLPPAIPELRRRLLLAELVLKLGERTVEQAILLAGELGRLLDQVETERLGFERLAELVPERYAAHWQITLDFLRIVSDAWPEVLASEGAIDPAARRNRLLDARCAEWRAKPPEGPVIAAGSTGSIPATAELLDLVARLPQGRLLLPGLDRVTDAAAWDQLEPSHPQYGLKRLLEHIGIERRDVKDWPPGSAPSVPSPRAWLIAQALLPAESTDSWRRLDGLPDGALDGIQRLDCPTSRAEAGAVALLLREALETEDRTAALVTLDRALARRVAAELRRWGIEVDDSAGTPLAKTPPGSFLSLLAAAASERLAPLPLLALLKHPLAAGGRDPAAFRADARLLERTLLRGPRPAAGLAGLRAAVGALEEGWEREALTGFVARLERRLGGFSALLEGNALRAPDLIAAHLVAAEALAATAEEKGAERLWAGEAGEQAANFIAELGRAAGRFPSLDGRAYGGFFDALLAGQVSRPRFGRHPRLFIWGPLEARLQHADLVILGGLNEGSWPPEPPADPWMSRPMRQEFGLPQPERRIGLSAHDFAELAAAPSLMLTRALKSEGTPTVPARWLLRLDSLLRAVGRGPEAIPTGPWLGWQAALDRPDEPAQPLPPPEPRPPVAWRPRRLRVTDIEHWMRDPYAIYARYVLGLKALDALDEDPGAAHRGRFIHDALDRFVATHPDALPADAREKLLALGTEAFGAALERPGVRAFWWPRFERIAAWFVEHEAARRTRLSATHSEIAGEMTLLAPGGDFILAGRADRIDRLAQGGLAIIDYKTGQPPKAQDVQAGFAPQLPLEAAMAEAGGFPGVAAEPVIELAIWRLTGGDPPGEEKPLKGEPVRLAREARAGLEALVAAFDAEATPYVARPRPDRAPRYSDYVHLARVKEWAALGGDIEE